MDPTFLGLLDNHINAINAFKNADEGKNSNDVLLKTIKLLIENVNCSDSALSEYDTMEMRKLFASFGRVAQMACDFYEGAKKHLDPVALSGEIGRKLESATIKIAETNGLIESIEKDNAELLQKESELDALSDRHRKKEARITELKTVKDTVTPEVLEKMKREIEELEAYIKEKTKEKDELAGKINDRAISKKALSDTLIAASAEKKEIEEDIIETIEARIETLREICAAQSKDLDKYKVEIEHYLKEYSRFADEFNEIKAKHSDCELHFGENCRINSELRKYDIPSMDGFADEIARLENTVGSELARYDGLIKNVLVEQDRIKESKINRSIPGNS
jgi:chromosome segregation ATPase